MLLTLDLSAEPPLAGVPDRVSLRGLTSGELAAVAREVGTVAFRAHAARDDQRWPSPDQAGSAMARVAQGEPLGRLLDCSVLASRDDALLGACLVVDRAGDPPLRGPWVLDVFADPDAEVDDVEAAMLAHAARSARSASLAAITIEVPDGDADAVRRLTPLGFAALDER
jgi:hypothetical protein